MKVVILAGGLGTRLKPFTDVIPKPLLPLGEKSLLEVQIEALKKYGVEEVFIAVNYKSDFVKSFLGDGTRFGLKISFSEEEIPLGTCGPVKLLQDQLTEPFILMNGDILTKANFKEIYETALTFQDSDFTIVTKMLTTPFRFGSIQSEGNYVTSVEEKPNLNFEILAGIYVLKPAIFDVIPENQLFGIDHLINKMLSKDMPISKYLLKEYWLNIGIVEDYEEAREIYKTHFKE